MKKLILSVMLAGVWGAAGSVPAHSSDFERVTSEEDFRASVVGRTLKLGSNAEVLIAEDGTVSGKSRGKPIAGTWIWRDGFFCRNLGSRSNFPTDNCQKVEVKGAQARFTANEGKGRVRVWDMR